MTEHPQSFEAQWLTQLMGNLEDQLPPETYASLLKGCSLAHYRQLNMDTTLAPFLGDLPGFLRFISQSWGWVIDYNEQAGTISIDENKDYCVCPLISAGILKSKRLCA
ncbi:MAG: hypothetical protein IH586_16000, partial [Anaerolineaceae bacterium]|nr:hypothetical protein [Anaerolineaceae bacterium]